ncbi:aminopeptidase P N-terminal domain-containing protein [Thermomonas sp.]|uniref:aminopeptidase P N-terminal domain-containing protein n=1 Tax=Thermomonas sp. TaxID=1971895 RepID=UPI0026103FD7|nr:aminopeptidase P N-terminal domain-containing protein [Thermomonas sp.]
MPLLTAEWRRLHAARRKRLMDLVGDAAIVVLAAAPERVRSRDTLYPYRQDSNFLYLTGFLEPDAVLALVPGRRHGETILFCRERDPAREGWDGPRLGPERAGEELGVDDAYPISDIDDILPGLMEGRARAFYPLGLDAGFDLKLIGWVNRLRGRADGRAPQEFLQLGHLLDEMRLFKSEPEVRLMQRAVDITIEAHRTAMRAVRGGVHEYALQAEVEREFRRNDAQPAYASIVGAGANGCILHYGANASRVRAGELVLIDAGAEYCGYAADLTRTFPASGRYSREQRALHDLVCRAQDAALAQARPGAAFAEIHAAAVLTLCEGLLALGLLKGRLEDAVSGETYKRFYPHKTGHWLGLDVHDVGEYRIEGASRLLEPGMVFTVEPGLYVPADAADVPARWRGIGIRIEDDVLVTRTGHRVLSAALERTADEVEAFMAGTAAA